MKHSLLQHESSASESIRNGVDKLARICAVTLGPCGGNVMLEDNGTLVMTKDGVTVANQIELRNKFEDIASKAVIRAARDTAEMSGDGTTTTVVLANSMLRELGRYATAGMSMPELLLGAGEALETALSVLERERIEIDSISEARAVAVSACNGDGKIADLVLDAISVVGDEGMISVRRDTDSSSVRLELVEGMAIDRGMYTKVFANHGSEHVAVSPYILIYDRRVEKFADLSTALDIAARDKRPIVVVAHSYKDDVIAGMMANYAHAIVQCVAVAAPFAGHKQLAVLRDLACMTGATVVSEDLGLKLTSVTKSMLGQCAMVVAGQLKTTFSGGFGDPVEIANRIKQIQSQIDATPVQFDRDSLQERLSRMIGAVATINVGGRTDTEIGERKYLIDDCLFSTRSALEFGILPGGGAALFHASKEIKLNPDSVGFRCGQKAVITAMQSPLRQIAKNMGIRESVVDAIEDLPVRYGPSKDGAVDMIACGVMDSYKTVVVALKNAHSIATTLANTASIMVIEGFDTVTSGD